MENINPTRKVKVSRNNKSIFIPSTKCVRKIVHLLKNEKIVE